MEAQGQIEIGGPTVLVEGVLNDDIRIESFLGGKSFATCTIRPTGPVGESALAQNSAWQVVIHRAPAVEQMKAALPGDIVEIHGVVEAGRILVPRTNGRVDILLSE
mgnify:CR=1 FL=1